MPSARSSEWRGHRDKLATAKALEIAFLDPEPNFDVDNAKADVDTLPTLKMACLYVDHHEGDVRQPSDVEWDAGALIERARVQSAFLRRIFDHITPEIVEMLSKHGDELSQLFEDLIDEQDPEGSARRVQSVMAAFAPDAG